MTKNEVAIGYVYNGIGVKFNGNENDFQYIGKFTEVFNRAVA